MSSRISLPLRLVQCDWGTAGLTATSAATRSSVLTPYKPCGLPCYAASQVSAAHSGGGGSDASPPHSADGRRLFAVHTRHSPATGTAAASFEAGAQPRPEDPSDSLLTRIVDASLPGCRPYVALPVVSSLLRRGGSAALLNHWTSRHKGLVLVTQTPSDALFLRNAAHLDLVQQTFRVACHLPAEVAEAVRRYLHARQALSNGGGVRDGSANGQHVATAAALNPYLRSHAERQRAAQHDVEMTHGIPLARPSTAVARDVVGGQRLPAGVRSHPLVSGGFYDAARGLLRVQGTASCFLRAQTPLHPASARKVQEFTRLQNLFAPSTTSSDSATRAPEEVEHPWLKPAWRLGVSLDTANMQAASAAPTHSGQHHGRLPAPRGKHIALDFRLLSVSAHAGSDIALYEVHTRGDVTSDEVSAVFQAEGLAVLNDYVQDTSLAAVVADVAKRMRAAPPGVLSTLPMAVQHYLRTATAEELVALPLALVPLEDADRLCIHHLLGEASATTSALHDTPRVHLAEDGPRLQQYAESLFTNTSSRHPLQRLLWHAVGSLHRANKEEHRSYEQLLCLTLGSGVECVGVAFPDPTDPATVHAMQHIWLTYEQQRQRHPSLAEAARAAQQHPLAAELRYRRRSSISDPTGLTRIPLLEGMMARTAKHGSRGECSFSHAVALTAALHTAADTPGSRSLSTLAAAASALDAADAAHTATVWSQTEVPPSYTEAFRRWAAISLPHTREEEGSEDGAAALSFASSSSSSLWPPPSRWETNALSRSTATRSAHTSEDDEGQTSITSETRAIAASCSPVRAFLRVEELAELTCAQCGAAGHTWQHCGARIADAVAALEETAGMSSSSSSSTPSGVTALPTASMLAPEVVGAAYTSVMEEEGLTTVEEAAEALRDQASALADRRMQRADALAGYTEGDGRVSAASSSSSLVPVPNMAATQHFKAVHALRNESRKPAVHRRTVRCVYCGGHHHVTACPKLQATDGEFNVTQQANTYARSTSTIAGALPLFCIKCGGTGHVYMDCPQVPGDLHPATHCPLCRQPRKVASHDPLHCPRRRRVPAGYALSGVPEVVAPLQSSRTTREWRDDRASLSNGGTGVGKSGAQSTSGFARPRRRRGSVLIADSFVDSATRNQ